MSWPSSTARHRPARVFGKRVREYRQRAGLSQEKLGELTGLHATYLSDVERGTRNVTLYTIVRIAKALKVNPGDLVDGLRP